MIPIRLALHNFMCYRDNVPPISFESIHTACISGNNGNGKSALVDAMTWALWGETRAASDDELVHAGQHEAEVQFEFALGPERYRIIRKHSRPKTHKSSGQTILEFQLFTPGGYKVLSGDTVTQTQQKITQLLHMDYDTFINSAFLRQGRADEFTKKRAGERKQVLGNILQLSIYDELEEQAREKARQKNNQIGQLEASISGMQEDLARKPIYQSQLEQAVKDLKQAEKLMREQDTRLSGLRNQKQSLENKKAQLAELTTNMKDTQHNYNLWNEQAEQHRSRIKGFEMLISERIKIEENYRRFVEVRKECLDLDQKFKQVSTLTQAKHRLEISIVKAGEELNRNHAVAENRIHELELIVKGLPDLQEQMKRVTIRLREQEDEEVKLQDKRETSKVARARVHFLQAEKIRLSQEINQVEEKLKMLSHKDGVTCPLCETELGSDGQKRIESKYNAEKSGKRDALNVCSIELSEKEIEVRSQEEDILRLEVALRRSKEMAQSECGTLNKSISDALEAREKVTAEKTHLEEIEDKLARKEFAVNEQLTLEKIENEIADCAYDPQQHDLLRSQHIQLEQYEKPMRQLEEAERLILREKEAEEKAGVTVRELGKKLEGDNLRIVSLSEDLVEYDKTAIDLSLAESEYLNLLSSQKQIQEAMGGAKVRLETLAELEMRHKEKEGQRADATREEKIFRDLAQSFGKKGIQAMLIEMAIPEIEGEANKLLSRMTDNRMHVKIETQRETKKGEVMETLDINISDELGTRNYEMFSGGEAFRIDFAIRIALSKLLARRAGAPLPTLIIDEGFGTQDSSGIEKVKEAITSIQDDFEKILVITHIADFKEAFPVRIEVVKTPEGSTVSLN